jgi:hypothetical protein
MTTPTNEEVRRQFEADAVKVFHNAYREARMGSPRRAGATYAAVQAVVDFALSSPAVVALVETATDVAQADADGELTDELVNRLRAALAPFTTGAGHVE